MKEKKIIENDVYRPEEYQRFDEYQKFPAEHFKSLEHIPQKMEEYKTEEIKKVSFVEQESSSKKKEKDDLSKKIREKILSQTSSSAVSATTSAAAVIAAGAVGACIVILPIVVPGSTPTAPTTQTEPSVVEPVIPSEFGSFELDFYDVNVETLVDTEGKTYYRNTVTLTYENNLLDGFISKVSFSGNELIKNDDGYYTFTYDSYENENEELSVDYKVFYEEINEVHTASHLVKTRGTLGYSSTNEYEYLVTYNQDDTTNLYLYKDINDSRPSNSYTFNEVILLKDENGDILEEFNILDVLDTETNIISIEDIPHESYTVENTIYYSNLESKHTLATYKLSDLGQNSISKENCFIALQENRIRLITNFEFYEDFDLNITIDEGLVDEYFETNTIYLDTYAGFYDYHIYGPTETIEFSFTANINSTQTEKYSRFAEIFKGEISKELHFSETVRPTYIPSNMVLDSVEVYQPGQSTLANFIFKGFASFGESVRLDIYDSSNNMIESYSSNNVSINAEYLIINLDSSIPSDQELTFNYVTVGYDGNDIAGTEGTYTTTLSNDLVEDNIPTYDTSGSLVHETINKDLTYNLYLLTNYDNQTTKDYMLRCILLCNDEIRKIEYTNSNLIKMENINDSGGELLSNIILQDEQDPIKKYIISEDSMSEYFYGLDYDSTTVLGYIYEPESISITEIDTKKYTITVFGKIQKDFYASLGLYGTALNPSTTTFDPADESHLVKINKDDTTYDESTNVSTITLDLSAYTFESVLIEGYYYISSRFSIENIQDYTEVKGSNLYKSYFHTFK